MKTIIITTEEFKKIEEGRQTQIILNDFEINNKDKVTFECGENHLNVEITAKAKFNSLSDCFKIVPFDLFGVDNIADAFDIYKNIKDINVYRLKADNMEIESINDKELLSIIKSNTLKKNNIGHSNTNVYEVETVKGEKAILKIQHLSNRNDLSEEYKRIKWLQKKFLVPKLYYYKESNNVKYLLMQKLDGISAHKCDAFAFKIGQSLKQFHNISIDGCEFKQNCVEVLKKNALDNIEIIYPQVKESYPDMTKQDLINFLEENVPKDKVLVHGDYSLPNVLIDEEGNIGVIDLGDVSISSKYFDFFYIKKSFIRNRKQEKLADFFNGYGIDELNEKYMKWVEIVDKALF